MKEVLAAIIGIIATPFVMRWMGNPLHDWYLSRNKKFSNKLYQRTAKQDIFQLNYIFFYMLVLGIVVASELFLFWIFEEELNSVQVSKKTETILDNTLVPFFEYFGTGIVVIFVLLVNITLIVTWARQHTIYMKILEYKQSLLIIKPLLTEKQFVMIQQQWALMESKEDYEEIQKYLNGYVEMARKDKQALKENQKNKNLEIV